MQENDSPDFLKSIKTEYLLANQAHTFKKTIGNKRHILEQQLLNLRKKVEDETLKYYRSPEGKQNTPLPNSILANHELLKSFKKTLQELDHKLDHYDDVSIDMLTSLRHQYIDAIIQKYPEKEASYRELEHSLTVKVALLEKLFFLSDACGEVKHHIQTLIKERKRLWQLGFIRYLFGRSPTAIVAKGRNGILERSAAVLLAFDEEVIENPQIHGLVKQSLETFSFLKESCQKRWRWKMTEPLSVALDELIVITEQLPEVIFLLETECESVKKEIEVWMGT